MKKGDVVVFIDDQFRTPRKVTRVLKDGRVQIGKYCWNENELRPPTDEELQKFIFSERTDKVMQELREWRFLFNEDDVGTLETILERILKRYCDESSNN